MMSPMDRNLKEETQAAVERAEAVVAASQAESVAKLSCFVRQAYAIEFGTLGIAQPDSRAQELKREDTGIEGNETAYFTRCR